MPMQNQKILITGATGQIGRGLAHVLAKHNEVHALARFSNRDRVLDLKRKAAQLWTVDMGRDKPSLLPTDFDVIFHMAVGWSGDDTLTAQNESFHLSCDFVAELMRRNRAATFVLGSTGSIYQLTADLCREDETPLQGRSTYETSKIAMSHQARWLAETFGHKVAEMRYWYPFAPYQAHPKVDQLLRGEFGKRNSSTVHQRTYIANHIEKTIAAAAHAGDPPQVFNSATDENLTYAQLAVIGARVGKVWLDADSIPPGQEPGPGHTADTEKMVRLLGPTSISTEEGLRRYRKAREENITVPEDWMFQAEPI